jgi:hypothetical protein
MSILRSPRPESNYYVLDKAISEDKRLSWAARGMLIFLLGKPDHWKVSVASLVNETESSSRPSRRDAVYALIKELKDAGYVQEGPRRKRESGEYEAVGYIVCETPLPENPEVVPLPGYPDTVQPDTANPTLVSNECKQELNINKDRVAPAALVSVDKSAKQKPEPQPLDLLPADLDRGLWETFLETRKKLKAVNSPRALAMILKDLERYRAEGYDINRIVERSVRQSWKDVYRPEGMAPIARATTAPAKPAAPRFDPPLPEIDEATREKGRAVLARFKKTPGAISA